MIYISIFIFMYIFYIFIYRIYISIVYRIRLIMNENEKVKYLKTIQMMINLTMKLDYGKMVLKIVIMNQNLMYLLIIWYSGENIS